MKKGFPVELQKELLKYLSVDVYEELLFRTRFIKMDLEYYRETMQYDLIMVSGFVLVKLYGAMFRKVTQKETIAKNLLIK